jgi:hypothetical protein
MAKSRNSFKKYLPVIIIGGVLLLINFILGENKSSKSGSTPNTTQAKESSSEASVWQEPLRYQLVFGDNFNKSLASQDELGLSIIIAVDCSGSMSEAPKSDPTGKVKYHIASESLTEIITFLTDFYEKQIKQENTILKLGLLTFNSQPRILYNLQAVTAKSLSELKAITSKPENFEPNDKTALGDTLKMGTEILAQSGTIFKSLILITDGLNTTGDEPTDVLSAIIENRNNKNTRDFPVITNSILVSFIGFDIDSDEFSNLADLGARVTSAANRLELNESLKRLFLADITRLEAN